MPSLFFILNGLMKGVREFSNSKLYFITIAFEGNYKKSKKFASLFFSEVSYLVFF